MSNLFSRDEMDEILQELIPVMKKEFPRRPPSNENLYEYFMMRTRQNLHVVLCFSPVGFKAVNTLSRDNMVAILQTTFSNEFFSINVFENGQKIPLRLFWKVQSTSALDQVMAWWQTGDKPLPEPIHEENHPLKIRVGFWPDIFPPKHS